MCLSRRSKIAKFSIASDSDAAGYDRFSEVNRVTCKWLMSIRCITKNILRFETNLEFRMRLLGSSKQANITIAARVQINEYFVIYL